MPRESGVCVKRNVIPSAYSLRPNAFSLISSFSNFLIS
nr:MAG TPA: hypothetical protein [Bacteriophage sp.]